MDTSSSYAQFIRKWLDLEIDMQKKHTKVKMKSSLALAAFLVVALTAVTLTGVGAFSYVTLNLAVPADANLATTQRAPFSVAAVLSSMLTAQEN